MLDRARCRAHRRQTRNSSASFSLCHAHKHGDSHNGSGRKNGVILVYIRRNATTVFRVRFSSCFLFPSSFDPVKLRVRGHWTGAKFVRGSWGGSESSKGTRRVTHALAGNVLGAARESKAAVRVPPSSPSSGPSLGEARGSLMGSHPAHVSVRCAGRMFSSPFTRMRAKLFPRNTDSGL